MATNPSLSDDASRRNHDPLVADLVTRAGTGDQEAWDALVERYAPLVWFICRRHGLGDADAEDAGQNVWLTLVRQLDRISETAALPGWLATTTRRECIRILRSAPGPHDAGYPQDLTVTPDDCAEAVDQELLTAERHAALRAAFGYLSPCCRRLIAVLLEDPPLSYAEISARLGISVGSIGPTRRRCLDKLRRSPAIAALMEADATG